MAEKPPTFTVTDRRKFTLEGDLRDENSTPSAEEKVASEEKKPAPAATEPAPGPRLVTKSPEAARPASEPVNPAAADELPQPEDEDMLPEPTAQESADQHTAYQQSSRQLDEMLRQSNPELGSSSTAVTIDHVIQSIYLSAVVAMGAATEPGQKPRIDILGARQSIDMLSILQEKTKGNLTEKEQRLLQNILFELRMMFLEITNAISQQAQHPPMGKK